VKLRDGVKYNEKNSNGRGMFTCIVRLSNI
jgi:hypothetical protein